MGKRIVISLCMITLNEENNIAECINSVKGVVDEIVVVDTGSTDRTREIASGLGAKVFRFAWRNNFSSARNFSILKAKGEYILWLDADDRMRPSQAVKLAQLKEKLALYRPVEAFYFLVKNTSSSHNEEFLQLRLFPRIKGARFEGRIHEQIYHVLLRLGVKLSKEAIEIDHTGYHDPEKNRKKAMRNLDMLLAELSEEPSNAHALFHLANTYATLGDSQKAVSYYERMMSIEGLEEIYPGSVSRIMLAMASEYAKMGDFDRYEDLLLQCLKRYPDEWVARFFVAELCVKKGKFLEAKEYLKTLVETDINPSVFPLPLERIKGLIHKYLGICFEAEGQWQQATYHMEVAMARLCDDVEIRSALGRSYLKQGRDADALLVFSQGLKRQPEDADMWCNAGVALKRLGHLDRAMEACKRALEIDPLLTEARVNLGQMYLQRNRAPEAKEQLEQVPWMELKMADVGLALATATWLLGDIDGFASVLDGLLLILEMPREVELKNMNDLKKLLRRMRERIKGDRASEVSWEVLWNRIFGHSCPAVSKTIQVD